MSIGRYACYESLQCLFTVQYCTIQARITSLGLPVNQYILSWRDEVRSAGRATHLKSSLPYATQLHTVSSLRVVGEG